MDVGRLRRRVTLSRSPQQDGDADGYWEPLHPERVFAAIEPIGSEGRMITHAVLMRFHPQVRMDTRIVFTDRTGEHQLFVRSFQQIEQRGAELRLMCEEVVP